MQEARPTTSNSSLTRIRILHFLGGQRCHNQMNEADTSNAT
jgi:hypothetical protein